MGLHNFHICNEQLTTSDYARDGWIFFSFSSNFSNAGTNRPWRKHMNPKASETKNKLQVDKSKVKEKIDKNVIASKIWNDQWHVTKLICQGPTREFIVQPRGMFLNSFWLKIKIMQ
jgi:hypothetical protein